MESLRLKTTVNNQGVLHIQLPEYSGEELELLLVYQPTSKLSKHQWSQRFLETSGAWQGEALHREAQEQQPPREKLL
ncbi:hypothetical protein Lepto7376_1601 [[Leptolyngbya] sp. PCC 7376]|uniref:hypothetical protein n=1 Tax=[Leptolyngbya] sp. PCC 7376 TaxID=111781 RepID=UPI00029F3AFB|nr:hypothetical protein [[Leptolyngbya] sp. PCC 7376]AFY37937.1 hypothetical protein Lepto7376_1601 [[Leptolyngbya] sp. PCC 7376]